MTTKDKASVTAEIGPVKGRPMLSWVGKRALSRVNAFPAQLAETYHANGAPTGSEDGRWEDWPAQYSEGGLLFYGDNKEILANLLTSGFRGKVNLIYIDPPFDSAADYVRQVQLRGANGSTKIEAETHSLGEQIQYTDIWANDNYLQFMYERLIMLKELLAENGSFYLHCDPRRSHLLRCLMDEVFGIDNFQNEIVWERTNAHNMPTRTYVKSQDVILFYTKADKFTFNRERTGYSEAQLNRYRPDETGRLYTGRDLTFSTENSDRQFEWRGTRPPSGRSWGYALPDLERLWSEGRILVKRDGTPRMDGLKVYLDETKGKPLGTIWTDVNRIGNTSAERLGYPTQKPEELLMRIMSVSSEPGDIVLDCFIGSGTTAAVAQKLGRRWIGCDVNKGAIQTTSKRLQKIMSAQVKTAGQATQNDFDDVEKEEVLAPTQTSFSVYRVNDYDLAIQHNEAANLACEHIGIDRTKTDGFFDGTLGTGSKQELVKIVPFDHPLGVMDLEDVRRELEARGGEETRGILLVCVGKELQADHWLEEWNKHRGIVKLDELSRPVEFANKIWVIELRTDQQYGKFFVHQPAQADVKVDRADGKIRVEIEDFISPTIVERLGMDAGDASLFKARITDWRAMIDSVMIDSDYDGEALDVTIYDVPESKNDLVKGAYELDTPGTGGPVTVAVKITDMLGEEVLITEELAANE
ncbi:MAG: Type III restriction-modification system methylation subunit [uncultured Rubrobacteraceae bacterium]|uniref:Type III restriction-modification system methylation subunit n=1 Tax=uncultured Rubrobacteraceae bacterium TaxID=349277 RepID=A0A6J4QV37_9ACTN|nr:MAG: Type III restriction-modification system methylation subunit [uncultured Rubrobacteraceae bacterium]